MDTDTYPVPEPAPPLDTSDVPSPRGHGNDASPWPVGCAGGGARQDALPFDDEAEVPVAFALTARGKRVVAPEALPSLEVVGVPTVSRARAAGAASPSAGLPSKRRRTGAQPSDQDWPGRDDPSDTRPSRARALHRAGLSPAMIAEELDVDPLLVRAWTGQGGDPSVGPTGTRTAALSSVDGSRAPAGAAPDDLPGQDAAFELARSAAADRARGELATDAGFAAGLGLLVGTGEIDRHAVTIATTDPSIVSVLMRWLDERLVIDPARVRVVLRAGPAAAGDLTVHRWSRSCGMDRGNFAVARWHDAPRRDAVQGLLRIADPAVAATVAGWRDALLAPAALSPADLAF